MKKVLINPPHALSLLAGVYGMKMRAHFDRKTGDDDAGAGDNDGDEDKLEIKSLLKNIESKLAAGLDKKAAEAVKLEVKSLEDKITALGDKATKEEVTAVKSLAEGIKDTLDLLDVKVQKLGKVGGGNVETKSFNTVIAETIEANKDAIQNFKSGQNLRLELKAVGDMSIAANFPTATALYQEQRGLYVPPFEQTFLGDILPSASSGGTGIVYPERNGGEGSIEEWDGTEDKEQVDYDFIKREISFAWLAGILIIEREMLDDIAWLTSYIQNQLLLDLKTRENAFILNRAVTGLLAKATAYNGSYSVPVERLIDAAYGQLPEDTFGQNRATHFIMRPRDTVAIGLNKAAGSQEFDLPQGTIGFQAGALNLSGIQTIATTSIAADNFLAIDARATQFVKRMQPELRMFEDATLAKKNKIMFRIEERVALAVFNPKALVKGTLTP